MRKPGAYVVGDTTSAAGLGKLLGIHSSTVTSWIKAGMPIVERVKTRVKIDLAESIQWARKHERSEADRLRTEAADPDGSKARKLAAEAKLRELDVEERESKLLAYDAVEERWLQVTTSVREAVLAIAGTAVQDGVIAPGKEAALDDIVRAALTSIPERKL